MRLVILESPYAAETSQGIETNVAYARKCLRDSLLRGESPLASHLLYTQENVLDDKIPHEREMGINAGLVWGRFAEATIVYIDLGISRGMRFGIERARNECRVVEYRRLETSR